MGWGPLQKVLHCLCTYQPAPTAPSSFPSSLPAVPNYSSPFSYASYAAAGYDDFADAEPASYAIDSNSDAADPEPYGYVAATNKAHYYSYIYTLINCYIERE